MASRIVLIAVIGCGVLASLGGISTAHDVRWDTELVRYGVGMGLPPPEDGFKVRTRGRLRSVERRACVRERRVALWKSSPGAMDERIRGTVTNHLGRWRMVAASLDRGKYYVAVKRRVLRESPSHRHVCKALRPALRFSLPPRF